jgi:anti-anti-sigma factor
MAIDWSDNIVLAQLNDEPALSDELAGLIDQLQSRASAGSGADDPDGGRVPSVVLDFSAVNYINSSNIAQLLQLKRVLDQAGRQLRLAAMTDEVWSVMLVTGLEKVFTSAPDTLTALAGLQLSEADAYAGDDEDEG